MPDLEDTITVDEKDPEFDYDEYAIIDWIHEFCYNGYHG